MTPISSGKYVELHYTVSDRSGTVQDTSVGGTPLGYIHGAGQMVPGFEKGVEGLLPGAERTFVVSAEEAYGHRDDTLVKTIPRSALPADIALETGMQFEAQVTDGIRLVTISALGADTVTLDANHPLAGEDLTFQVQILAVEDPD